MLNLKSRRQKKYRSKQTVESLRQRRSRWSQKRSTKSSQEMLFVMFKILIVLCVIMMLSACGSSPRLSLLPTPSQQLMKEPCKASEPQANSDDDLQADVETLKCMADLRLNIYRWQSWYKAIK